MTLAIMLTIMVNETRMAHDGLGVIEAAGNFRPDITPLDMGLPKLNGSEASRRIREQPWLKAMMSVALTGWGRAGDRRRFKEAGFMVEAVEVDALRKMLGQGEGLRRP